VTGPLLVTGAQGFVGRWTVAEALRTGSCRSVVGLGRSPLRQGFTHRVSLGADQVPAPLPRELEDEMPGYRYHAIDLRDLDALVAMLRTERPSAVVHLASALRDEPFSTLFPVTVEGTLLLLRAIAESGVAVERFVLASSGSVYGVPTSLPLTETQVPAPPDLYAVSKLAAEHAGRIAAAVSGIPLVVARIFNVVGPGLDERHACARFASQLAAVACGRSSGPIVVGDLTPQRDFIDVRDVAQGLLLLAQRGGAGVTYNVASGRATSIQAVFNELAVLTGLGEIPTAQRYVRAVDPSRIVADISRITALGYEARYTLSASLADLYAYYAGPVASALTEGNATIEDARAIASGVAGTQG
jgi:GDP-4-dehydro-6-deoxy-D-mannose reductase